MARSKKEIEIPSFGHKICNAIGNYVYRLVDPRNGETFYVGEGIKDRVFKHLEHFKRDKKSNTYDKIKDIHDSGLEVIHIIHKHNLPDKKTAKMVEAALMESYPGLANRIRGSGGRYGQQNVEQIITKYGPKKLNAQHNLMFVSVNSIQSMRRNLNTAVRSNWGRASDARYVIAVFKGETVDGYVVSDEPQGNEYITQRINKNIQKKYIGKRLPDNLYRGQKSGIKYSYE